MCHSAPGSSDRKQGCVLESLPGPRIENWDYKFGWIFNTDQRLDNNFVHIFWLAESKIQLWTSHQTEELSGLHEEKA